MKIVSSALLFLPLLGAAPQDAADLLRSFPVKKGICVVAGTGSETLPVELARQSELLVYVQSDDAAKVAAFRKAAEAAGFLGSRVYVEKGSLDRLHLAADLADV